MSHHIKLKYQIKSIKYIEATENKIGNSNRELKEWIYTDSHRYYYNLRVPTCDYHAHGCKHGYKHAAEGV